LKETFWSPLQKKSPVKMYLAGLFTFFCVRYYYKKPKGRGFGANPCTWSNAENIFSLKIYNLVFDSL